MHLCPIPPPHHVSYATEAIGLEPIATVNLFLFIHCLFVVAPAVRGLCLTVFSS